MSNIEHTYWFVMRDLKRSNAKNPAWRVLADKGFEIFTPMRERLRDISGKKIRERVPVIPDLLFVKSVAGAIDDELLKIPTLQYRFVKGAPYRTPMVVPDADMERFIAAVSTVDNPVYYLPSELTADMCGRWVRIVDGPLAGYEGRLLKVRGITKRKLLISLRDFVTAAVEVDKNYIQFV